MDSEEYLNFDHDSPAEIDKKTKLMVDTYREVLDATKHQDDKIGRLLTAVAFLTAASLGFAGLSQGAWITQRFGVPPYEVPLGLVTLAVFLLGVVFTVVLLLASLATPLRLPGFALRSPGSEMRWVNEVPASQLYFLEIAQVSVDEWRYKWRADYAKLEAERFESLVRETHNLGVRTSFKYDRFNEAVAALSVALLSFATAAALVAFAAGSGTPPVVELGPWHRLVLATIMTVYCGSQLVARVRSARPSVEDSFPAHGRSRIRRRVVGDALFALLVPATIGVIVLVRAPNWFGAVAVVILVAGCYVAYWLSSAPDREAPPDPGAPAKSEALSRRRRQRQRWLRRSVGLAGALGYAAIAASFMVRDHYAGQLGVAAGGVLLLVVPTALSPVLIMRARRHNYLERLPNFEHRVSASAKAAGNAGLAQQVSDMTGVADRAGESDA